MTALDREQARHFVALLAEEADAISRVVQLAQAPDAALLDQIAQAAESGEATTVQLLDMFREAVASAVDRAAEDIRARKGAEHV